METYIRFIYVSLQIHRLSRYHKITAKVGAASRVVCKIPLLAALDDRVSCIQRPEALPPTDGAAKNMC